MSDRPGPRKVIVVDDDDISRRGITAILEGNAGIELVEAVNHDEALARLAEWPPLDVLIIDAADTRRSDDHFIGAEVVHRFRRRSEQDAAAVIVVTGHFLSDPLRRRMRDARADLYLHRSEVQDEGRLLDVVLDPSSVVSGVPEPTDAEAMFRVGVTPETRVNEAVAHHVEHGWDEGDGAPIGKRSRANARLRQRFQKLARLHVVNADGRPPDRHQDTPSRPQIERFLEWATRSDRR
jgi:CheY-like chemotaxis protein